MKAEIDDYQEELTELELTQGAGRFGKRVLPQNLTNTTTNPSVNGTSEAGDGRSESGVSSSAPPASSVPSGSGIGINGGISMTDSVAINKKNISSRKNNALPTIGQTSSNNGNSNSNKKKKKFNL